MKNKRKRPKQRRKSVRGVPFADLDIQLERFLKNIDKAKGRGARLGQIARDQITGLLDHCFVRLLQVGLSEQDSDAKQWAGKILARVYMSLHKHHGKLSKINSAYQHQAAKLGKIRQDVLLPASPVGQILQKELRTALRCWSKLGLLRHQFETQPRLTMVSVDRKAIQQRVLKNLVQQHLAAGFLPLWTEEDQAKIEKAAREAEPAVLYPDEITERRRSTWEDVARQWKIPKAYWQLKDFPPLSEKTEKEWWDFIWKRLNEQQAEILPRLRAIGKGRAEAKEKPLYLKDFYKQFRKHWLTFGYFLGKGQR